MELHKSLEAIIPNCLIDIMDEYAIDRSRYNIVLQHLLHLQDEYEWYNIYCKYNFVKFDTYSSYCLDTIKAMPFFDKSNDTITMGNRNGLIVSVKKQDDNYLITWKPKNNPEFSVVSNRNYSFRLSRYVDT